MKIVLPGGSGQVGQLLARRHAAAGHEVVVLGRGRYEGAGRAVPWDGRTVGAWASEIDGADVVINLAGRTVNCRYTTENLAEMMRSRVDSTRAVGEAIAAARNPPRAWLQMSTATIYAHTFESANDEDTGLIGGSEPDVPAYWEYSVRIAREWERTQRDASTPRTRKVQLRASLVMSPDREGIFDVMSGLVRKGLGGTASHGRQYVSWIHDRDFLRAVDLLVEREDVEGPINLAAPNPVPNRDFQRALREAWGARVGLPAAAWMLEVGAFFLRTDTELLLKSRRVVSSRLPALGFIFDFPHWSEAARDLVARHRAG